MTSGAKKSVLVVEDSPVIRQLLVDMIQASPWLRVAHAASDGVEALAYLRNHRVDVVSLDVNMPNLGGLETLREIMRHYRTPCLMVSSKTRAGAKTTLDALAAGAVDFFTKPAQDSPAELAGQREILHEKLWAVANCRLDALSEGIDELSLPRRLRPYPRNLVLIGSSTGGPATLSKILGAFPSDLPASFVIAQHMPTGFTQELAQRLSQNCLLSVREAEGGELCTAGSVLVLPAGKVCRLVADPTGLARISIHSPKQPLRTSPSIDGLFQSALRLDPRKLVAVILTGMGEDGCLHLEALADRGARILAESEESSVVFGMPRAAIATGKVHAVVSKSLMAEEILYQLDR